MPDREISVLLVTSSQPGAARIPAHAGRRARHYGSGKQAMATKPTAVAASSRMWW